MIAMLVKQNEEKKKGERKSKRDGVGKGGREWYKGQVKRDGEREGD